jgi:hypothetical protein
MTFRRQAVNVALGASPGRLLYLFIPLFDTRLGSHFPFHERE